VRKSLLFFWMVLLPLHVSPACEVIQKLMKQPAEENSRPFPFLKKGNGKEEALPLHTIYLGILSNEDKSIWGINFHETSDYNDVDLVVCNGEKPIVMAGLFEKIEPILTSRNVLPRWPWDNQTLEIKAIVGNSLTCYFHGDSHTQQKSIEKTFTVIVSSSLDGVHFTLP
jgi:hypothetical protein